MTDEDKTPESKLNAFLDDWDKKPEEGNKELAAEVSDLKKQLKEVRETTDAHDKALKADQEAAAYKEDIKPAIATIGGETKASNRSVHDWLNGEADENPKLRSTWDDREKNPEAFEKMLEELAPKFKTHIEEEAKNVMGFKDDEPPDQPNESEEEKANRAAAHAMRVARGDNAPAVDEFSKIDWPALSDNEFARESEKVFEAMRNGDLKPEKAA